MSEAFEIKSLMSAQEGTVALFGSEDTPFHWWEPIQGWGLVEFVDENVTQAMALIADPDLGILMPVGIDERFIQIVQPGTTIDYLGHPMPDGTFEHETQTQKLYDEIMDLWSFGLDVPPNMQRQYQALIDAVLIINPALRLAAIKKALAECDKAIRWQSFLSSAVDLRLDD